MLNGQSEIISRRPVPNLPIEFKWREGVWKHLFDKQVKFVQQDLLRALSDNKFIVYLSCPISSRGGSYFGTNVEIANYTAERLSAEWGPKFWVLNPVHYQMESNQGLGLIRMHAHELGLETNTIINVDELIQHQPIAGGDYMRMWARILAEDDSANLGGRFAAFYFLGPSDISRFFARTGAKDLSAGVESYFASKFASDPQFRAYFSESSDHQSTALKSQAIKKTNSRREDFFRFYTILASACFSRGSHDEWNIWQSLNIARGQTTEDGTNYSGLPIPGYFDGQQINPGSMEKQISPGYDTSQNEIPSKHLEEEHRLARRNNNHSNDRYFVNTENLQIQTAAVSTTSEDELAIKKMYDEALTAFRRGDLEGVLDHWEDDGAYLWPAVKPSIGKVEIRAAYEAFFSEWSADEKFYRHEMVVSGDLAYSRFGTELTLTPKIGGTRTRMTLQGTHIYHKNANKWKFKLVMAIIVPEGQF